MEENKAAICKLLTATLQATRNGADVVAVTYSMAAAGEAFAGEEFATVEFRNGYKKKVCVTADSGTAMIKDILSIF